MCVSVVTICATCAAWCLKRPQAIKTHGDAVTEIVHYHVSVGTKPELDKSCNCFKPPTLHSSSLHMVSNIAAF